MDDTKSHVIVGHVLSQGEKHHVQKRVDTVLYCLEQNGIDCTKETMPNIAVLGSGGGLRAMVALLASLGALDEERLLDSIMYLSGVSGSTWCMSSLYNEPDWSSKLKTVTEDIKDRLVNGKVTWWQKYYKLMKYFNENNNFSLTHVWAAGYVSDIVKKIDEDTFTWQQGFYTNDPYPIYTVIDKTCEREKQCEDMWFEITPHRSGYSNTGAFVNTKDLGSKFVNGSSDTPNQDLFDVLYLQGLCGSALADRSKIFEWIREKIKHIFQKNLFVACQSSGSLAHKNILLELSDDELDEESLDLLLKLQLNLMELSSAEIPSAGLVTYQKGGFDEKKVCATKCSSAKDKITDTIDLCKSLQKRNKENGLYADFFRMILRIMELTKSWTWGTTCNFLYKMNDSCLKNLQGETRYYEDAGLELNSPYLSVLRKERKVDMIISLDFSDGDPFETVTTAAMICTKLNIPFPDVKKGSIDNPEDFYVFKGDDETPTVIHMPLFNKVNCPGQIEDYRYKYRTTVTNYTADMMSDLLNKAALNITNNNERILDEIKEKILQKQNK